MRVGAFLFFALSAVLSATFGWLCGASYTLAQLKPVDSTIATLLVGFLAAILAILAALIAVWGVYSQRVLARRQATMTHITTTNADASVQKTISQFIGLTRGQQNLAHFADKDKIGSDEQLCIISVLNHFELISTGIQRGIFEYELINQYQANSIKRYWAAAHPFVVALRQRVGIETLWIEFEKLNGWVSGKKSPLLSLWWTGFG